MGSDKAFIPDDPAAAFELPDPKAVAAAPAVATGSKPAAKRATPKAGKKATKAAKAAGGTKPSAGAKRGKGTSAAKPAAKKSAAKAPDVPASSGKAAKPAGNGQAVPMTKTIEEFFLKGGTMADGIKAVEKVHGQVRPQHIAGHLRTLRTKRGWTVSKVGESIKIRPPASK